MKKTIIIILVLLSGVIQAQQPQRKLQEKILYTNTTLYTPRAIQSVDINGDGDIDLICEIEDPITFFSSLVWKENVSSLDSGDTVVFGTTNVIFTIPNTANKFIDFDIVDMNNDGAPDIIGIISRNKAPYIFINDGSGQFTIEQLTIPPGIPGCCGMDFARAVDIDGDTIPEIIYFNPETNTLWAVEYLGNNQFGIPYYISRFGTFHTSLLIVLEGGDIDNDGDNDMIGFNNLNKYFQFFQNNNVIPFNPETDDTSSIVSPQLGFLVSHFLLFDIREDTLKDLDIVIPFYADGNVQLLEFDNGTYLAPVNLATNMNGPFAMAYGDYNNDGFDDIFVSTLDDIFVSTLNDNKLWCLLNNQNGGFNTPLLLGTSAEPISAITATDFNNDGFLDLATAGSRNTITLWENMNCRTILPPQNLNRQSGYTWLNGQSYTRDTTVTYLQRDTTGASCDTLFTLNLTINRIGLNELAPLAIDLHPNPAKGIVHLKFNQKILAAQLSLINMQGQVLEVAYSANASGLTFTTSPYSAGHYLLRLVTSRGQVYSQRLVVQ
jgi:hypothetical protein